MTRTVFMTTMALFASHMGNAYAGKKKPLQNITLDVQAASDTASLENGEQVVVRDDSFKATPESWLGRVGVIYANDAGECPAVNNMGLVWQNDYIRFQPDDSAPQALADLQNPGALFLGYQTSAPGEPDLRGQTHVNEKIASQIRLFNVLGAQISREQVLEVIVTDLSTQRVLPSKEQEDAVLAYRDKHPKLFDGSGSTCWVFVVNGYTYKLTTFRKYTDFKTSGKAGFSGINVEGSYYVSEKNFETDHAFALSLTQLARPVKIELPANASLKGLVDKAELTASSVSGSITEPLLKEYFRDTSSKEIPDEVRSAIDSILVQENLDKSMPK